MLTDLRSLTSAKSRTTFFAAVFTRPRPQADMSLEVVSSSAPVFTRCAIKARCYVDVSTPDALSSTPAPQRTVEGDLLVGLKRDFATVKHVKPR